MKFYDTYIRGEKMIIKLLIGDDIKEITINAAHRAQHGEILYLAEPQHVDYYTKIKFNSTNYSHQLYLKRGLLFYSVADALLFVKSFLREIE